jgi:hypothetical protein
LPTPASTHQEDYDEEAEGRQVLSPEEYIEQDIGNLKAKCVYLNQVSTGNALFLSAKRVAPAVRYLSF